MSIPASTQIMKAKLAALSAKQGSTPIVAIKTPATAGPITRAA